MRCSKPLEGYTEEFCPDCKRQSFSYDQGFAAFLYQGKMQESLMRFKYGGRQEYGKFYAQALSVCSESLVKRWQVEVLIPVPVHPQRLRMRGYNQAEVLAQELSSLWQIPVDAKSLARMKKTKAQKELDPTERRKNLKDAFVLTRTVGWKSVLIIDDIYTTGSTVHTLGKLLKEHGVKKVYFLTVCIGKGN